MTGTPVTPSRFDDCSKAPLGLDGRYDVRVAMDVYGCECGDGRYRRTYACVFQMPISPDVSSNTLADHAIEWLANVWPNVPEFEIEPGGAPIFDEIVIGARVIWLQGTRILHEDPPVS